MNEAIRMNTALTGGASAFSNEHNSSIFPRRCIYLENKAGEPLISNSLFFCPFEISLFLDSCQSFDSPHDTSCVTC